MAGSRVGFRGRTRSPTRRKTARSVGPGSVTATAFSGTSAAQFVGSSITTNDEGLTLIRLRGRLKFILNVTSSVLGGFTGAFGIGKATSAAVAAGVASIPTPITEQSWDGWLYWVPVSISSHTATIADGVNAVGTVFETEVDTKAMRKVAVEDSIYSILEFSTEVGTASGVVWFDSRVLYKLP